MSFGYESPPPHSFPPRRVTPTPRGNSSTLLVLLVLLGLLLSVMAYRFWPFGHKGDVTEPDATPREVTPRGKLWDVEQGIVDVAAKASKSVVHIRAQNPAQGNTATGSGFIFNMLNGKVYVVTNFHVIENVS